MEQGGIIYELEKIKEKLYICLCMAMIVNEDAAPWWGSIFSTTFYGFYFLLQLRHLFRTVNWIIFSCQLKITPVS